MTITDNVRSVIREAREHLAVAGILVTEGNDELALGRLDDALRLLAEARQGLDTVHGVVVLLESRS